MIEYENIKRYLSNNTTITDLPFDDINNLLITLCHNHADVFESLVIEYFSSKDIEANKKIMKQDFSYVFFRFFYFFYVAVKHIYTEFKINDDNLKALFLNFLKYTSENKSYPEITKLFIDNYEYLHDTFFVKDNLYFNVYFNNLIKYFLPLPHNLLSYIPFLTYRNINKFYKKNNDDLIDVMTTDLSRFVGIKNVNAIKNEMDMHIPIQYFNNNLTDVVYLVAYGSSSYTLLIANDMKIKNNEAIIKNIQYTRTINNLNPNKNPDLPFQLLFPKWEKTIEEITISQDNIKYISVMRKIKKNELFNVFEPMTLSKKSNSYLFHNTEYPIISHNTNHILNNPSFFYSIPQASEAYQQTYFKERKCMIFEIEKDIDNLIDLTLSISTNNPFNDFGKIRENHRVQEIWKSFNLPNILDYYDAKQLTTVYNENYKCVTVNDKQDIDNFVKSRPYCDIGHKKLYVGRRKLYEILLKTRNYDPPSVWPMTYLKTIYKKANVNVPDNSYDDPLYNSALKIQSSSPGYLYDTILLKELGYNGFFFTDFQAAYAYGGEVLLTTPKHFIKPLKYSHTTCNRISKFTSFDNQLMRSQKQKYAYVSLLMGNNIYFIGALIFGYSLKQVTNYDIVIMVTPDVPDAQKNILREVYDVVLEIDYVEIDKGLIKDYDHNRFKDIFTKLQCFKLTQYEKIIMIDIDMLIIRDMDDLFNLKAPAASLKNHDLKHGEKIPKNLIIKNGNLIGSINAGVMLLKPSIDEYGAIVDDIKTAKNRQYKLMEQEYLSERYHDQWTNISFLYNFQFGLSNRAKKYDVETIHNLHYSSRLKPWRLLYAYDETMTWINEEPINVPYYKLWMNVFNEVNDIYLKRNIDITKLYPQPISSSNKLSSNDSD